jgi:hypothetical protein
LVVRNRKAQFQQSIDAHLIDFHLHFSDIDGAKSFLGKQTYSLRFPVDLSLLYNDLPGKMDVKFAQHRGPTQIQGHGSLGGGRMTRFFPTIDISWRELGQSALRTVVLTTAAGLMIGGKYIYLAGVALKDFGETKLGQK